MGGKGRAEFVLLALADQAETAGASWVIKHKNTLHKILTEINSSQVPPLLRELWRSKV